MVRFADKLAIITGKISLKFDFNSRFILECGHLFHKQTRLE